MIRTIKGKRGKEYTPRYYALYVKKNGQTIMKTQSELDYSDFDSYPGVIRIELYRNGTENLSPLQIDVLYRDPNHPL